MNCEDVPLSEWDKLTGAEAEALIPLFLCHPMNEVGKLVEIVDKDA